MSCEIIIRQANRQDALQREELIHLGFLTHQWSAFIYFLLQELTLEAVLLCAAVMFIFVGASPAACLLLVPVAVVLVGSTVIIVHHSLGHAHKRRVLLEHFGLVAEARGPLGVGAPQGPVPVRLALHQPPPHSGPAHTQVVGTVSVSEFEGPRRALWLHGLAVDTRWRRRGVGLALVGAARHLASAADRASLEALVSDLQPAARALLLSQGWECRGTYERRLLGPALTLPLTRLGVDLPGA